MIKETDITAISAFLQQFATKQEDRERLQSLLMAFGYKLPMSQATCNNMNQILLGLGQETKRIWQCTLLLFNWYGTNYYRRVLYHREYENCNG